MLGPFPLPAASRWWYAASVCACASLTLAGLGHAWSRGRLPGLVSFDPLERAVQAADGGDLAAAVREYSMLTRVAPADVSGHHGLAAALARSGDDEGEMRALLGALDARPFSARAHAAAGLAFLRRGRLDDALGSLRMAVRLGAAEAEAFAGIGDIMRQRQRLAEAADAYASAVRIAPENAVFHNKLGIALALSGRSEDADRHFAAAIRIAPAFSEAAENLNRLRAGRGTSAPTPGR